jgi:PadR family transcriptional regulator PadR
MGAIKMGNVQKEVQVKIAKGLLELIILQMLSAQPVHGYEVISNIRKSYGVYFGPSTIYPLLSTLEKKKHVKSQWDMTKERPRKVYTITVEGQSMLNFSENSLNLICQKIIASPLSDTVSNTSSLESGQKRELETVYR